jgi:Raf kinase inhibitor-like YbhB/YbcL family protein
MNATALSGCLLLTLAAVCAGASEEDETMIEPENLKIESPAFQEGKAIPREYTGDGQDISPPLRWKGVPAGARQLVLIVDDPDAPRAEPWVHWVLYGLVADVPQLPEGQLPPGAVEGLNSWDTIGYRGPAPPPGHGIHHYRFQLFALGAELKLEAGQTKEQVLQAMRGHILATATLTGTYERH